MTTATVLDGIDFLQEVYADYVVKHKLPMVSADEQDWNELSTRIFAP